VWNEGRYKKEKSAGYNCIGFEQSLLFIGGLVDLLLTYIAGNLLNLNEYGTKEEIW